MKTVITLFCAVLLFTVGAHSPVHGEDNILYGNLTVKSDPCEALPVLQGTSWTGTADIVSGTGFHFGETLTLSITKQEQHLFQGTFTSFSYYEDFEPAPFYGVFLSCYQIRIAAGLAALFATLDTSGAVITGYAFCLDPLNSSTESQPNPNMLTFRLTRQE